MPAARAVTVSAGGARLEGDLVVPEGAVGVVAFAHGSGSSRHSPRNRHVAQRLARAGLGTLLMDLLTPEEEAEDRRTRALRFDVRLLGWRLIEAVDWLGGQAATARLPVGCFGASTGAAAALIAAAQRPREVGAVVSRGGRPDLAEDALRAVRAPTLLVVGGADPAVIDLNRRAMALLRCEVALEIVDGAGHLFEEPGALDRVADLAAAWFGERLAVPRPV